MRLHKEVDEFFGALVRISENTDIRADVLEKDYYVTLLLKELAEWQDTLPAYFKGGTALYKALGSVRRFSEDIDLTVCIDDCSNTQAKKRLEKAANGYQGLPRTTATKYESNLRGSITSLYDYQSIVEGDIADPLQRFGHVKVEATSFTVSEPFAPLLIAPLLYDNATESQKDNLRDNFDVVPFSINTIRLERIFVDKVFASEFYNQRKEYAEVSKHIYDLSIMSRLDAIQELLSDPVELTAMTAFKRREEKARIGSDLSEKLISDFEIFDRMYEDKKLRSEFDSMQNIYVFSEDDRLSFDAVIESLVEIKNSLLKERIRNEGIQ